MPFGPKHPTFKPTPYGHTRRRGIPRWLLLLITGIVLGVGGVLFLQASYGPQRLTVEQSEQLRTDLNAANLEKQQAKALAAQRQDEMVAAQKRAEEATAAAASAQASEQQIQAGITSLIDAIAPDPRGTSPGVRDARMVMQDGALHYHVLLIQDLPEGADQVARLQGELKLIAAGQYSNGRNAYVDLTTEPIDMGRFAAFDGTLELPAGYRARQVTVQVSASGSDRVIATRTLNVRTTR